MRSRSRGWRVPLAAVVLGLLAGCAVNTAFVYKPDRTAAGGTKLPVKVAVLPFTDGTEDFTDRGSVFSGGHYNLAKSGVPATMTAFPPEMWAKSFAEDLSASGGFQSVRFLYSPSELVDEDYFVEGTLKKAYVGKTWEDVNTFAVSMRVLTRSGKRPVWEREMTKEWKTRKDLYAGCGMGIQCSVDKYHSEHNKAMQEIFAAARADLMGTLASHPGSRAGEGGLAATPSEDAGKGKEASAPQAQESVEQTIDRILKGK